MASNNMSMSLSSLFILRMHSRCDYDFSRQRWPGLLMKRFRCTGHDAKVDIDRQAVLLALVAQKQQSSMAREDAERPNTSQSISKIKVNYQILVQDHTQVVKPSLRHTLALVQETTRSLLQG